MTAAETGARGLHARAPEAREVGRPQASPRRNSCALTSAPRSDHPHQPTPHPHPDSLLGKHHDRLGSGADHPYGARGAPQ